MRRNHCARMRAHTFARQVLLALSGVAFLGMGIVLFIDTSQCEEYYRGRRYYGDYMEDCWFDKEDPLNHAITGVVHTFTVRWTLNAAPGSAHLE